MAHLNVGVLTFIIATGIPMLTALVTKYKASSGVKAWVNLALVVAATAVQAALKVNGVVNLKSLLGTALVTYVIGIATYYGLLKPSGTTESLATIAPHSGIGKAVNA